MGDTGSLTVWPAGFGFRAVLEKGYGSPEEFRAITRQGAYRKAMRRYGHIFAPGTVRVVFEYAEEKAA